MPTQTNNPGTAPARGYEDAVKRSTEGEPLERAGRGTPDERRDRVEGREDNLPSRREGPQQLDDAVTPRR